MKTKLKDFLNEKFEDQDVYSEEAARKWFEKIKMDPELEPYINNPIMPDPLFKKFKRTVDRVLNKYKHQLFPREMEYVKDLLLELPFLDIINANQDELKESKKQISPNPKTLTDLIYKIANTDKDGNFQLGNIKGSVVARDYGYWGYFKVDFYFGENFDHFATWNQNTGGYEEGELEIFDYKELISTFKDAIKKAGFTRSELEVKGEEEQEIQEDMNTNDTMINPDNDFYKMDLEDAKEKHKELYYLIPYCKTRKEVDDIQEEIEELEAEFPELCEIEYPIGSR